MPHPEVSRDPRRLPQAVWGWHRCTRKPSISIIFPPCREVYGLAKSASSTCFSSLRSQQGHQGHGGPHTQGLSLPRHFLCVGAVHARVGMMPPPSHHGQSPLPWTEPPVPTPGRWDPDHWAEEGEAILLWDHLCAWQWPPLYLQVGFMVVPRAAGGTPSTRSFWADLRVVLCF